MKSENKVWLITGASSGFGRALAEEVLARGERVIGAGRHVEALADLVARCAGSRSGHPVVCQNSIPRLDDGQAACEP